MTRQAAIGGTFQERGAVRAGSTCQLLRMDLIPPDLIADRQMTDSEEAMTKVEMTAEIISAYVEHNSVPPGELPALIRSVHGSLGALTGQASVAPVAEPLQPKVPIKKSVANDYVVCLEDGRRFKSLKRHLHSEHGMTPDQYRAKWGLGKDYPMVAPSYANARSALAKTIGLGRKGAAPTEEAEPEAEPESQSVAAKPRGRKARA